MRDPDELNIRLGEPFIWYAPAYRASELLELADRTLKAVESARTPRIMVLETWIFLDFILREFVYAGLQLEKFSHPDFDPRYELLPRRFEGVLELIVKIHDTQLERLERPEQPIPPLGGKFLFWLSKNRPEVLNDMISAQEAYLEETEAELDEEERERLAQLRGEWWGPFRQTPQPWLDMAEKIDESWMRRARQLNRARNMAAHRTDHETIAGALGCSGPSSDECVRKHLIELLRELLGVVRIEEES